ncbi:23S rRNA (uracil(1939)-C(5))-methyltransferase RlmD [Candidatus Oscillochloris fontis]|uniref:23S rRNA (uracil(1939)-C(5))-methyltransferase RlmD n=1 Tax=Candidatus Oscillochloris fontis TaxID=2496868 RepID=UPI00101BDB57|nr:23S rRNA (uracil(1939)-C(5))-methyltransferase RlmD [Candidatus Oscillochloris fontis]
MRSKEFRNLVGDLLRAGETIAPRCPHAHECGGCAYQDRAYSAQIAAKTEALMRLFDASDLGGIGYDPATFQVVGSPDPYTYRTRMDYVATKGRFGLRARGKFNYIIELSTCHLIPPAAFAAAHAVWVRANELGLPDYNIRSHAGFLRYVVVRRNPDDQVLIAIVTAEGPYADEVEELARTALAQPGVVGFHWLLNNTRTDLSFGSPLRHWGAETLAMRVGATHLMIGPNTFFQNNVHLLDQLLAAVGDAVGPVASVADLYGGVGTIGMHLAPQVGQVISVEEVAESAALAAQHSAAQGVTNLQAINQDVLSYLRTQAPAAWPVAVVDPPRIGLGPEVCAELLRIAPQRLVYVSCNPITLVEDLRLLGAHYRLRHLTGYDMFPHTPHVEVLAVLE